MSDKPDETDTTGPSTEPRDRTCVDRRSFLLTAGAATASLAAVGSASACATDGEWYGYGEQQYNFSGYGGIAAPCPEAES